MAICFKVGKDILSNYSSISRQQHEGLFKSFYKQINLSVPSSVSEAEVALWLCNVLWFRGSIPIFWREVKPLQIGIQPKSSHTETG